MTVAVTAIPPEVIGSMTTFGGISSTLMPVLLSSFSRRDRASGWKTSTTKSTKSALLATARTLFPSPLPDEAPWMIPGRSRT